MYSIPFSLPDAYGGMAEADGILQFDGISLLLEFQVKDAIFGVIKSEVKKIALNADDIAAVQFKRKVFKGLITLRSHTVNAISDVPGQKGGEVRITIKKKYCEDAEELISALRLAVTEAKVSALNRRDAKSFDR